MVEKQLTKDDVVKIVKQEMKGGKREKRPLTEYQKHMSICLKKPGNTFESCIEEWKQKNKS